MKKIAAASIATAAGAALLLGGAGTFATWNDSDTAGAATITAGNLVVDNDAAAGVWTAAGSADAITIANYRVAPGDVLTYTKTMQIGAVGDSLTAVLGLTPGSITAADDEDLADIALAHFLESNATLTLTGDPLDTDASTITENTATEDTNDFVVTPGSTGMSRNVTVTVQITFPAGAEGVNNDAKTGAVNLSNLTVTLTQDGATEAPAS